MKSSEGDGITMGTYHTVQLRGRTFSMLPTAKDEFMDHHREFDKHMLSNDKIIYEALRYYIGTGRYRGVLDDFNGGGEK